MSTSCKSCKSSQITMLFEVDTFKDVMRILLEAHILRTISVCQSKSLS